jgi:N-acyl-D-amino-acid deacylase
MFFARYFLFPSFCSIIKSMFDVLIKNGLVVDGLGTPAFEADIAIEGDRITKIGFLGEPKAVLTIDASGLCVAPGFIDINNASDRYFTLFDHPNMESFLRQGVTTIIGGNCGSSLAPLTGGNAILNIQKWADISKINVDWLTVKEFFEKLKIKKPILNFGTLAGHSTLRRGIVNDEFRELTDKETRQMKHLLEGALKDGALGFSTGLTYSHVKMTPPREVLEMVSAIGPKKLYSAHLRDEGEYLFRSVLEAIEIARMGNFNLEISHFKSAGKENWPLFDQSLQAIENAAREGLNINFDVYPYTYTITVFYTLFPDWVAVGGRAKLVENLKNRDIRAKLVLEIKNREEEFRYAIIASGNIDKSLMGKTIDEIARNQDLSVSEVVVNLLVAAEGKLNVFWPAISEENLIKALQSPLSIIASDGAVYNLNDGKSGFKVHPRSFGCFPRILSRYVREKNIISLEEAIKKMTALPALKIGLTGRGVIKKGHFADLTIFNRKTIKDLATFENPFQYSQGVSSVIVNGQVVFNNGKINNPGAGRIL